jgi:3-hydroxy-3-methylglutaryl CoA synthase
VVVIDGHAGYVPLYRIDREEIADQHDSRGSGESAVPGRDENHVTMASEAADIAIDRSDVDADDLDAVFSASVSEHFAEHGIAGPVAYRVGATGDVRTGDFRATGRAATDALAAAHDFVSAHDGNALVVAADVMPTERGDDDETKVGAGAGALVLRADARKPAAAIDGFGQETTGFVERHREHGEPADPGDARFERRHGFRPAVEAAAERADAEDVDHTVVSVHSQRMASSALRDLDAERVSTHDDVGYAGAATFYVDLAHALEESSAEQSVLAVGYGQGGADAVALETDDGVETPPAGLTIDEQIESKEYVSYAEHLEYRERYDYRGVPST